MNWRSQIQAEFDKAEQARSRGNEGRARVCARRAAGLAARQYFARQGRRVHTTSVYDVLNLLIEDRTLDDDLRQASRYLTMRVNEEFNLPVDVDLVVLARKLCERLLVDNK
jgi:hypothetical protein